eukprot:CAMPEP_0118702856 /NCGR_PEP_ID=MMETSP0800-20121206/18158_1 /TAXON_ID=210618 ORGANISM="Striatella unipunctata, Strain CCMP2910" /NCGR_SAMPLE_ID=MMETSP0800 /ASSEMBLY_ACC=CAM_ASM_000638 /LENGTH=167 /DNA_ID=CAMNT_0006604173 /DNA_START=97 /DNA_END=597 /DNA_ORIENTATION=-
MSSSYPSLQPTNWDGSVPIVVSLAPTSLSSPSVPMPLHALVSRMTYLHVGLKDIILRMYTFAPVISPNMMHANNSATATVTEEEEKDSNNQDDDGDDDEEEGILEERQKDDEKYNYRDKKDCPVCWFEDEENGLPLRWQLFVGILHDMMTARRRRQDEEGTKKLLPW